MIKALRDFRIIPVVLFAGICLLTLKVIGILRGEGYVLINEPYLGQTLATRIADSREPKPDPTAQKSMPLPQKQSWAQELLNYPDVTGSVPEKKPESLPQSQIAAANKPAVPPKTPDGTVVNLDTNRPQSPAERALLERLQERRQEIEARGREMDMRDGMLKAAEMKLEARIGELKAMEERVNAATQAKDEGDNTRFKSLVAMYENMKPKDAARIFDRLELPILVQVVSLINPRKMSDILGQMSPEAAERLTVELAARVSGAERTPNTADLPKIQGKPGG